MATEKEQLISDEMSAKIVSAVHQMAISGGAQNINVRRILQELGITNRVFYNRFHNIDEVLEIVYKDTILKIRESVSVNIAPEKDFFEQIMAVLEKTLIASYEVKQRFNHYVFEHDSISKINFEWWLKEIKKLVDYAKANNLIKDDIDSHKLSYSIWCFCRGCNADAVGRNMSKEEALTYFRYGFGILFDGIRK